MSKENEDRAQCITITIVGALPTDADIGDQLNTFVQRVEQAIWDTFPDFLPARPPITVTAAELRDDWIKTRPKS